MSQRPHPDCSLAKWQEKVKASLAEKLSLWHAQGGDSGFANSKFRKANSKNGGLTELRRYEMKRLSEQAFNRTNERSGYEKILGILLPPGFVFTVVAQDSARPLDPVSPVNSSSDYTVVERGPHHRVWEKLSYETNALGTVLTHTNAYTELTTGLHYRDPASGEWKESDPSFELTEEGYAVARKCQHQVIVSPNLNSSGGVVVDLQMPDGQRLRSGIVGLNLFDPASGKSLQIAAVRDVVGTQVSSNEIVWFDAFEGLKADVRVRNERGQFHQDVLLREKLSARQLASLGFDANTVRLEV